MSLNCAPKRLLAGSCERSMRSSFSVERLEQRTQHQSELPRRLETTVANHKLDNYNDI